MGNAFTLNFPPGATVSPAPNPYTNGPSAPGSAKSATYYNTTSYQIISAGGDRFYGAGGQYSPQSDDPLPGGGDRVRERDNLSNFSTNRLD
jgi:hypothetical protein